LAASSTKVVNGHAMKSVLNTTEVELDVEAPLLELEEAGSVCEESSNAKFEHQDRGVEILTQLRLEHLNAEVERVLIFGFILLAG